MRVSDDTSLKRLRQTAWSLGVALAGETPASAFTWALLVQQHLYFCWASTRPWWVFRRLIAAVLYLAPWREYGLICLQLVVVRLARETNVDLPRLYQAIERKKTPIRLAAAWQLESGGQAKVPARGGRRATAKRYRKAAEDSESDDRQSG